ncbi:MAG: hypothetical protein IKZ32_03605 [Alistipes sp.]|nr:hypothetical protein [Alistipes sp.]
MGIIQEPKRYSGRDLETIFFRPMISGESAEELGIRTIYNMPMPTTIQLWSPQSDVLQRYSAGWTGGETAVRKQKEIAMTKVKAEVGFSASDYFNQVYELITNNAQVSLDDLTGSELEKAETEMFRAAIAESLRAQMWLGDTAAAQYSLFDGFIKLVKSYSCKVVDFSDQGWQDDKVAEVFKSMWSAADSRLRALKKDGHLAFFVTSEVYDAYESFLDQFGGDSAYTDVVTGRHELSYHGIPVIDMHVSQLPGFSDNLKQTCILTDRRNLVLAVNTNDYPGAEVRMWYNPDEMENRQRATFLAGCEILDEELVVTAKFNN